MSARAWVLAGFVVAIGLAASGCAGAALATNAGAPSTTAPLATAAAPSTTTTAPSPPTTAPPAATSTTEPEPATTTTTAPRHITVAVAGDVLSNEAILHSVAPQDQDYAPIFGPIAPYLQAADYTVVNLETRLAGADRGYSSFPRFNAPDTVAAALQGAGVDMVAEANNHALDQGWEGMRRTLDVVEAAGLASTGAYRSQTERDAPQVVSVGGIDLCFLSYTSLTNGFSVPKDRPYALNLLDPAVVAADAAKARAAGADLVVAIIHWGVEYARRPNPAQQKMAETLLRDCGVDVIVGGHPHVLQPIEKVPVPGSVTGEKYVAYSVGNFMSSMITRYSDCGVILYLDIEQADGDTWVTGIRYLPVYMYRAMSGGHKNFRILPAVPGIDPGCDLPLSRRDEAKLDEIWGDTLGMLDDPAAGVTAFNP